MDWLELFIYFENNIMKYKDKINFNIFCFIIYMYNLMVVGYKRVVYVKFKLNLNFINMYNLIVN